MQLAVGYFTHLQPRRNVRSMVQFANMLQNSKYEFEFGHTAAVVQVGQKVQLLLQLQQLLPLRQVLAVLDKSVQVVDRQS